MNLRPRPQPSPELNLTPLVDVVFLLLLFFMVSTTFEQRSELPIALPEANGQPIAKTPIKPIVITIDRGSSYAVADNPLPIAFDQDPREALLQAVRKVLANNEQRPPLRIEADADTPHQAVMRVLDVAQQLGLTQVAFATRHAPAGSAEAEDAPKAAETPPLQPATDTPPPQ